MPPLVMDTRDDSDDADDADDRNRRVSELQLTVKATAVTRTSIATLSLVVQMLLLLVLGCLTAEVWVSPFGSDWTEKELRRDAKHRL